MFPVTHLEVDSGALDPAVCSAGWPGRLKRHPGFRRPARDLKSGQIAKNATSLTVAVAEGILGEPALQARATSYLIAEDASHRAAVRVARAPASGRGTTDGKQRKLKGNNEITPAVKRQLIMPSCVEMGTTYQQTGHTVVHGLARSQPSTLTCIAAL